MFSVRLHVWASFSISPFWCKIMLFVCRFKINIHFNSQQSFIVQNAQPTASQNVIHFVLHKKYRSQSWKTDHSEMTMGNGEWKVDRKLFYSSLQFFHYEFFVSICICCFNDACCAPAPNLFFVYCININIGQSNKNYVERNLFNLTWEWIVRNERIM